MTTARKTSGSKKLTAEQKSYLATLSPKLRRINEKLIPLEGKLTKAIKLYEQSR